MVFRKNVDIVIEMLSSTGYIIVIIRYLDLLEGFVLLSKPLQKLVRSELLLPSLFRNSLRLRHWLAIFGVLLSNTETNRTTEHLLKELTFFFISNLLSINYKYSVICKVILSAIGYQNRSMAMGLLERISFKILAIINLFIWNILKWVW